MYGCESWNTRKAERRRIDAFELWCWRRHLRVLWTARRSNQLILKEINSEYSLEGLMLKFQSFGHPMWRADSLEKTLTLGKIKGRRQRGATEDEMVGWNHRLNRHESEQTLGDSQGQGSLSCCSPWGCKESDTSEGQNNKFFQYSHYQCLHSNPYHFSLGLLTNHTASNRNSLFNNLPQKLLK